jgi:glutathione S-transferase
MELHDNAFSPFSFKVRAVLYEKRAEFSKCERKRTADREALLRLNPRGEVPVLVDGDAVICDSKVICAYLEDRFPEPELIPKDPALRACCRYLELKSDTDIDACLFVLAIIKVTRPEIAKDSPAALERAAELLSHHYAFLEQELAGRDWFLGAFSLVDIALAPHLRAAAFLGHPPGPEHPGLLAWLTRIKQRPSLRQATREMAEAFAASQSGTDSLFNPQHLHWRNDRIEAALRCGLGPWLLSELEAGRAFLSPVGTTHSR